MAKIINIFDDTKKMLSRARKLLHATVVGCLLPTKR